MVKKTPTTSLIPILISIDVEPDGVFIDPKQRVAWHGFEHSETTIERWREDIERATGRKAHFTWLLRMDPQVGQVYGSLQWAVGNYPRRLERIARQGDEIGLHVHPYRWSSRGGQWVADYGNQDWVENCVRLGFQAFAEALGRTPRSFSMGNSWLNQPTVRALEKLGVDYDLSLLPGSRPTPIRELLGSLGPATGSRPDCSHLPPHPFRPAADNFTVADPARNEGLWLIPITTSACRWPLWLRMARLLRDRKRHSPGITKLGLELGPGIFGSGFNQVVESRESPHLLLTIRSSVFLPAFSRIQSKMQRSLQFLLSHPQVGRLAFSTPAGVLKMMGLENGEGSEI